MSIAQLAILTFACLFGPDETTVLRGRALDEGGKPFASAKLDFQVQIATRTDAGTSSNSKGRQVVTDANGRFEISIAAHAPPDSTRTYLLQEDWHKDAWDAANHASADLRLPSELTDGLCNLGDVYLVPPGSTAHLRVLSDAQLAERLHAAFAPFLDGAMIPPDARPEARDGVLTEIVRRGGEAWEVHLARELSDLRARMALAPERAWELDDVELLTALRRVQKRPNPLRVEIAGAAERELVFLDRLVLDVRLTNGESAETLHFQQGGDYRSGRLDRWRIEAAHETSGPVPIPLPVATMDGGMSGRAPLAPGETWSAQLDVASYVPLQQAGKYTIRVRYHDDVTLADRRHVRGLVTFESADIRVSLVPRTITVTRAEHTEARKRFAAIDVSSEVHVVNGLVPCAPFEPRDDAEPFERVLALGGKAVPALLEIARDANASLRARAWAVALLYSITGVNSPVWSPDLPGALGESVWHWGGFSAGEGGAVIAPHDGTARDGGPRREALDELAKRWAALKPMLVTNIVE